MAASRKEYRPVALADQYSDEDHDGSEPKSAQEESSKSGWSRTTSRHRAFLTLNVTIFCLSVMFFIWSIVVSHGTQRFAKNGLLKETSSYSPLFNLIDIPLSDVKVNGSLIDNDKNIYRQPPSPATDAAWERLTSLDAFAITREDIIKMGKNPDDVAKYPESFGLGSDAYVAELDLLHKIHCLNAIRRDVYFDYYFLEKYPDRKVPELHATHTSHCLHVILQSLMCDAGAEVVTQVWVEGQTWPFPDFSVNRKCRDFEAIAQWQKKNHVPTDLYNTLRMPEGHVPLPMSDEFKRQFQYDEFVPWRDNNGTRK